MSDIVIRAEGLGKRYRRGLTGPPETLRDALTRIVGSPLAAMRRPTQEFFWALRDVGLEVRHGEVLGLIGRNGAGKTTLLKILSRITRPTTGWAEIHGRVRSLLEVGTGFHGELSGRENTYLSGSILGMAKREIDRKFDEIVAFAEVDKFIDTPVKHYSSGMYVRLAFAVAAHLEPEILLVDEVLAVGDAAFQKKCLGKMGDVAKQGRTILFVSHNVTAVTRLCNRCVLMDRGSVVIDGETHQVINSYLRSELATSGYRQWQLEDAPGDNVVRLRAVRVRTQEGEVAEAFDIRQPIAIDVIFDVLEGGKVLSPNIHIFNAEGVVVFITIDQDETWDHRPRPCGRYTSTVWIPGNFLAEGTHLADVAITTFIPQDVHFHEHGVVGFEVVDSLDGNSVRGDYAGHLPGVVRPLLEWETTFEPRLDGREIAGAAVRQ
jgi:homopolymeric O-antigen transport system ATP-binding protein